MSIIKLNDTLICGASSQVVSLFVDFLPKENKRGPFYHYRDYNGVLRKNIFISDFKYEREVISFIKKNFIKNILIFSGTKVQNKEQVYDNRDIVRNILEKTNHLSLNKILIASSSSVYGNYLNRPFEEIDECRPISYYGESKLIMEKECYQYYQSYKNVHCLRLGNILGADALIKSYHKNKSVEIHQFSDNRGPLRTYIRVKKLLHILMELLETKNSLPFVVNVGDITPIYMEDLAERMEIPWVYTESPHAEAFQKITLNCCLLESLIEAKTMYMEEI